MPEARKGVNEVQRIERFRWTLIGCWSLAVAVLLVWIAWEQYETQKEDARIHARSAFDKDIAYRRWNAAMGGVYVPVTERTPPDPYLEVPERDVVAEDGRRLTLMNPAYMTRLVHEQMAAEGGLHGHITSLDPIRPQNAPDAWERRALRAFERGVEEVAELEVMEGRRVYRLMRPLYTEEVCLQCHQEQGYELGDIRGGISVAVPFAPFEATFRAGLMTTVLGFGGLWLVGLAAIQGGARSLVAGAQRRAAVEEALREASERFRLLYEEAPVAYQSLDGERRIVDVNPAWLELLGVGSGHKREVLGRPFDDFLVPAQRPLLDERFRGFLARGEVRAAEFELVHGDGRTIVVSLDGNIGHDAAGGFDRTHCVLRDITERKEHEALINLQARRAMALLELPRVAEELDEMAFLQHGLAVTESLTGSAISFFHLVHEDEEDIELVAWSRRTEEDYCTAPFEKHYPVKEAGVWADALRQRAPVVCNDYPAHPGKQGLPEGHAELTRFVSVPIMEGGRVVMLTGVGNKAADYTDTDVETVELITSEVWRLAQGRRHLRALTASEARYRELVDAMSDGVAVYEAVEDGGDFVFRQYNRAGERIGGLPRAEVIGRRVTDVFPGVARMGLLDVFRRVWETGRPEELHLRRYDDERLAGLWVDNYVYKLPGGEIVAVYEDVTERMQAEAALRESETRFRELMEQSPVATTIVDLDGRLVEHNPAFESIFGVDHEVLAAFLERYRLFDDEQVQQKGVMPLVNRAFSGEELTLPRLEYDAARTLEAHGFEAGNARRLWVRARLYPILRGQGSLQHIVLMLEDETDKKLAEDRLQQAAAVFRSTAEGVTITDLHGTIQDVNQAFTEITGYAREEVLGQNPRMLQSGRHDAAFYEALWRSLRETGYWRGEVWNRRKDGTVYPELLTISAVRDDAGVATGYVGVFTDITAMKQSEERLEHLAHHDPLTDLPNRLLFNARLRQSIRHATRQGSKLAVVFVDLDRFKHVNDSLGHPAGDELLKQLTARLRTALRDDDTVARISGDEFVVLLEDIKDGEHTAIAVRKLMATFERPFEVAGQEVHMTSSMGITLFPDDAEDAAELLRNADSAMYWAKDEGRNTYQFYTAQMTAAAFEHVFLENALRGALARSEFYLVYQPQVDLEHGRVVGVEVLLRWRHPEQGIISPARFVPVAEQSGLILDIGAWVLRSACGQAKTWLDQGIDFGRVAVNVAGPQIQRGGFAALVQEALADSGLAEKYLELELTEGFVMQRTEDTVNQLEELRALGIQIAIDDFGTGYSSLSYLKHLPIDKLKIDQSFVRDIPHDADDMAISEAVIALGRAMDMRVVAEGVETVEQRDFLRQKGCLEAQGFLFGRPMEAGDIEGLIARR